jgi:sentrin-specific protease 1
MASNDDVVQILPLEGKRSRNVNIFKGVSRDLRQEISVATNSSKIDQIVAFAGIGCSITGSSLRKVLGTNWLNDEAIDTWMEFLRDGAKGKEGVYGGGGYIRTPEHPRPFQTMTTAFWTYLQDASQYRILAKMCEKRGIADTTIQYVYTLCIPVNIGGRHWALGVVFPQTKEIEFYDSLGKSEAVENFANTFLSWWGSFARDTEAGIDPDTGEFPRISIDGWEFRHMGAQQEDQHECGVYVCWNAYCMARFVTGDKLVDMDVPAARLELAAILVNGGFKGEYALPSKNN